jgi:cell division protein FtsZ
MLKLDNLDGMKFEVAEETNLGTRIKVIGVGGAGGNAVARMLECGVAGVEFHVMNTDRQALQVSPVSNKLALGAKVTSGLGAGADPTVGQKAALEDTERIIEILEGADMVFVTAGLGGGTGTGAAPVVAALAKELGALTVAVVTKPFRFEGPRRNKMAERGLAELAGTVDTVISIPNDRLLEIVPRGTSFSESLRIADDVLRQAVQGISDIITTPGLINRDFSDIKAIMLGMGYAMMGTASASGEKAAMDAARKAINSPLLEDRGVKGARGILINFTAAAEIPLHDVFEACELIREATADEDVQINFGMVENPAMGEEVKITVIATGFPRGDRLEPPAEPIRVTGNMRAAAAASAGHSSRPVETEPRIVETPQKQTVIVHQEYAQPEVGHALEPVAAELEPWELDPVAGPEPQPVPAQYDIPLSPMPAPPEPPPPSGLDVPAFLRRERRNFQ